MTRLEHGFTELGRAVLTLGKAIADLSSLQTKLERAVRDGDLNAVRKAVEKVKLARDAVEAAIRETEGAELLGDATDEALSSGAYVQELLETAAASGIQLQRVGDALVAFPVVIRVAGKDRSLVIDGRRSNVVRPSAVVAHVQARLNEKSALPPERLIEVLYRAYRAVCPEGDRGRAVMLSSIYEVLTLLPTTYSELDFARDLTLLNQSGLRATKSGAVISLPASTGTKDRRKVYSFIDASGNVVEYFGIQFREPVDESNN